MVALQRKEERELDVLWDQRRQEQIDAIPRPNCCAAIQKYPVIKFRVDKGSDSSLMGGRWIIEVSPSFLDFCRGGLVEYLEGMPDPEYCPFCSSKLPKMVRKNPPPPNICRVTDGGYYCDICHERLDSCICDPPSAAFEPCLAEPLKTTLMGIPPLEGEP